MNGTVLVKLKKKQTNNEDEVNNNWQPGCDQGD